MRTHKFHTFARYFIIIQIYCSAHYLIPNYKPILRVPLSLLFVRPHLPAFFLIFTA